MSFDKHTRNLLARMVGNARQRLQGDITAQLQTYFRLQPDGTALPLDGMTDDQRTAAEDLRQLLDHLAASESGPEKSRRAAAYNRLVREIGFTVLNRLAALRLCEERGLVRECVRQGMASEGFRLFDQITGNALGTRYQTYRAFLESLFDELALDLGVLFDRHTPHSHVFTSERALEDVLALLNDPALAPLWQEDETIGWIYQYYNDEAERKKMRQESPAPRNSRELAVRNQFFTPRYVVEFLADNTLGRLWYEMRQGHTCLAEQCRYLVRPPEEGGSTTKSAKNAEESQEENSAPSALNIPCRKKKDPRQILMLDPAGGSGHFGLYCFDLFETIYTEAYDDPDLGPALHADYPDRAAFLREVPRLILAHNIHIIDIDPRACQIAALALWLRAQRSFQRMGLKSHERPRITRANVVCAEPMPGDKALLEEFLAGLQPPELRELVRFVFARMELAGETGSLLKIEEDLRGKIEELRDKAGPLFAQGDFWQNTEKHVLAALREYAERAANGRATRRHLFAEDAKQGFAFIDLCFKQYDVVLMNPPFGEASAETESYLGDRYPDWNFNLFCCFVARACSWSAFVGAIVDRAYMFKTSYEEFRRKRLLEPRRLKMIVDLGWEVLDANVEVNLQVFRPSTDSVDCLDISLGGEAREQLLLGNCIDYKGWLTHEHSFFLDLPNAVLSYALPKWQQEARADGRNITEVYATAKSGLKAGRVEQFLRLIWEVPDRIRGTRQTWNYFQNGSPYAPFYFPTNWVIFYEKDWKTIHAIPSSRITGLDDYWKPGLTYGKRTDHIYAYPMPKGQVFSNEGMAVFPLQWGDVWELLGFINSPSCQSLMNLLAGQHKAHSYFNKMWLKSPIKNPQLARSARQVFDLLLLVDNMNETSMRFSLPYYCEHKPENFVDIRRSAERAENLIQEAYEHYCGISQIVAEHVGDETAHEIRWPDWGNLLYEDSISHYLFVANYISYAVGCAFGRWDIRLVLDQTLETKLADPFDPLPVCPPGMLVGPDGLPAAPGHIVSEEWLRARPNAITLPPEGAVSRSTIPDSEYPIPIAWDGILVDDPGPDSRAEHSNDIVHRVREALTLLWGDRAESIEAEACEILGVPDLRDYFRKPTGFFSDHLKRYSKSRRQAPIYWPLSTASGRYTVWLYYHRLTPDTLFAVVVRYVTPKIDEVQRRIDQLSEKLAHTTGKAAATMRDDLNDLKGFFSELQGFRAELLRVAALPYKPDLNDGVIINAAPLHKLFRLRKWAEDTAAVWRKLEAGEYDWAQLAYTIWPERVKKVCETDRSIAIAHGLEQLCKVETKKAKGRLAKRKEPDTDLDE